MSKKTILSLMQSMGLNKVMDAWDLKGWIKFKAPELTMCTDDKQSILTVFKDERDRETVFRNLRNYLIMVGEYQKSQEMFLFVKSKMPNIDE